MFENRDHQWVYLFSQGQANMKALLGGKGANVAEMVRVGLPVPPGFTITTEACNAYSAYQRNSPKACGTKPKPPCARSKHLPAKNSATRKTRCSSPFAPAQMLTDRDFTGQRENREIELIYYQARFYVPYTHNSFTASCN